jgi:hypothetical protein
MNEDSIQIIKCCFSCFRFTINVNIATIRARTPMTVPTISGLPKDFPPLVEDVEVGGGVDGVVSALELGLEMPRVGVDGEVGLVFWD